MEKRKKEKRKKEKRKTGIMAEIKVILRILLEFDQFALPDRTRGIETRRK